VCVSGALLTQYLGKYRTYFHQTYSVDAFFNKYDRVNFWVKSPLNFGCMTAVDLRMGKKRALKGEGDVETCLRPGIDYGCCIYCVNL